MNRFYFVFALVTVLLLIVQKSSCEDDADDALEKAVEHPRFRRWGCDDNECNSECKRKRGSFCNYNYHGGRCKKTSWTGKETCWCDPTKCTDFSGK
jgi:hypothetical protein